MTELYRQSIKALLVNMKSRLRSVESSRASLKNQDSDYAKDHTMLIQVYTRVVAVIEAALPEAAPPSNMDTTKRGLTRWAALRELFHSTKSPALGGNLVEQVMDAQSELATALPILDALDRWLEARGLPADWSGDLDAWGWVVLEDNGANPAAIGYHAGPRPFGRSASWALATPDQRAKALELRGKP